MKESSDSRKSSPHTPFDADCPSQPPGHLPPTGRLCGQVHSQLHRAEKSPHCSDFLPVEISLQLISGELGLALVDLDGPEQNVKMEKYLGLPAFSIFCLCPLSPQSQNPSLYRPHPPFIPPSSCTHRHRPSFLLKLPKTSEMYRLDKQN